MPPSRIPLTFPPRTRSRSSTKSSSSSASQRLSKTAVLPSGNAFTPKTAANLPLTPTRASVGRSSASSEGSGSRCGSPALSLVSAGGGTSSQQGSEDRQKRSQSLGGVPNLPSILVSCLNPPSVHSLSNDRYSPPVHIPYVSPPAPKLFPSNPATPSRRATYEITTTRSRAAAAATKPPGVFRRNTTGSVAQPAKGSAASKAKLNANAASASSSAGKATSTPTQQQATKKKRKSTLSSETTHLVRRHPSSSTPSFSSSTSTLPPTSNQTSSSSAAAPQSVKPPTTTRRPSNLSSEITAQITATASSSPPRPTAATSHAHVVSRGAGAGAGVGVADGSSPITLHSIPGEGVQLMSEGGRVIGGVRV